MRVWMNVRGLALLVGGLAVLASASPSLAQDRSGLQPFASDQALRDFLAPNGELEVGSGGMPLPPPPPPPPPSPAPTMPGSVAPSPPPPPPAAVVTAEQSSLNGLVSTGDVVANPSITNNQVAGVDEGGIVKVSGDYLVLLRRGRLFSVSTARGGLEASGSINAYPPGVDGSGDWYDEMLVSGDWVVVIGYSYSRGGTEINRFRLGRDGAFTFVDSHQLRSNDYYSSDNYASRLVGSNLIFYTPLYFGYSGDDPLADLPALSRWTPGQDAPRWERTVTGRQVYTAAPIRQIGAKAVSAMHSVTSCDLTAPTLTCRSTVILGGDSRTFFVSQNAVYIWTDAESIYTGGSRPMEAPAFLYRLPFDGGRPQAVQVHGTPINQFSFNPNTQAGRMDVLLTSESEGDAMWNPQWARGDMALLRLPMSRFGDGGAVAPPTDYQALPSADGGFVEANRFVGDWLFYGLSLYSRSHDELVAVPVNGGEPILYPFETGIQRIEVLGRDALIVGGESDVVFTTMVLDGRQPVVGSTFTQRAAQQGESRSHAFFYRADRDNGDTGLMGLPILRQIEQGGRYGEGAEMLFLRRERRDLSDFGRLASRPQFGVNDMCVASCVDWYGNARPIFLNGRVFALMGYELVEGREGGAQIQEVRRLDFMPAFPGKP